MENNAGDYGEDAPKKAGSPKMVFVSLAIGAFVVSAAVFFTVFYEAGRPAEIYESELLSSEKNSDANMPPENDSEWSIYQGGDYGFAVKYPKDVSIIEEDGQVSFYLSPNVPTLGITIRFATSSSTSLADLISRTLDTYTPPPHKGGSCICGSAGSHGGSGYFRPGNYAL